MRLGRRLRRARSIEALAPQPAAALAPPVVAAAGPGRPVPFRQTLAGTVEATPEAGPEELAAPPAGPKIVASAPFVLAESLEPDDPPPPPASPTELRARTVEDIFAQAFAQGRPGRPALADSGGKSPHKLAAMDGEGQPADRDQ
jgi:hypothetical protein